MIGLWKKDTGNLMSHAQGLTETQIEFLQSLKPGDRLIAWDNSANPTETGPGYTLKKSKPRPKKEDESL